MQNCHAVHFDWLKIHKAGRAGNLESVLKTVLKEFCEDFSINLQRIRNKFEQ